MTAPFYFISYSRSQLYFAESVAVELERMKVDVWFDLQQLKTGEDWASEAVLGDYAREHRLASRPIYLATNAIVRLYGDARPTAQLARHAVIRLGRRLPFVQSAVRSMLLQA